MLESERGLDYEALLPLRPALGETLHTRGGSQHSSNGYPRACRSNTSSLLEDRHSAVSGFRQFRSML